MGPEGTCTAPASQTWLASGPAHSLLPLDACPVLRTLEQMSMCLLLQDEGKGKALKSSQAFFLHLQDQVKMEIGDAKKTEKKKKKKEQTLSVHKLKL